jgi:pilus assembly protein TadC
MSAAAALLGLALLAGAGPTLVRSRARLPAYVPRKRPGRQPAAADPLAVASSLDVLAVCLTAGMAVSSAAAATATSAPSPLADVLQRAANLLALGADPAAAWSTPSGGSIDSQTDCLLRLARRSACSGSVLADAVADLAAQCRHEAKQAAAGAAERAGVLIAGPLGLCFLPAFVCLGIVPTVAGLAGSVLQSGLM